MSPLPLQLHINQYNEKGVKWGNHILLTTSLPMKDQSNTEESIKPSNTTHYVNYLNLP